MRCRGMPNRQTSSRNHSRRPPFNRRPPTLLTPPLLLLLVSSLSHLLFACSLYLHSFPLSLFLFLYYSVLFLHDVSRASPQGFSCICISSLRDTFLRIFYSRFHLHPFICNLSRSRYFIPFYQPKSETHFLHSLFLASLFTCLSLSLVSSYSLNLVYQNFSIPVALPSRIFVALHIDFNELNTFSLLCISFFFTLLLLFVIFLFFFLSHSLYSISLWVLIKYLFQRLLNKYIILSYFLPRSVCLIFCC